MMMADDNAIDIIDRLPPIEVRKPWREKLPDYYIRHIDELVALHKNVVAICSRLRHPHLEQLSEVIENNGADDAHMRSVVSELEAAVVLLKCAEERLWHAIPFEEFLSLGAPVDDHRRFRQITSIPVPIDGVHRFRPMTSGV
jgi:hypothetical protein